MNAEKTSTFEQLDSMSTQAEYAYSITNKYPQDSKTHPQFHCFVTNANIGGVDVPVKLFVRENIGSSDGNVENRYYTHTVGKEKGNTHSHVPSINDGAGPIEPRHTYANVSNFDQSIPPPSAADNTQVSMFPDELDIEKDDLRHRVAQGSPPHARGLETCI